MDKIEDIRVFCGDCKDTGYVLIPSPDNGDQYIPCRECDIWSTLYDDDYEFDLERLPTEDDACVDDDWVGDAR